MKFELVNEEGCLMDSVETTSFKKARSIFANKFEGNYKIIFNGQSKNVRL